MRLSLPARSTGDRKPLVEVVIPCYNYGQFLPGCVRSALGQPGVDVRVTIVDDVSTDDSFEVAERLAEAHSQIKLIRNERNLGAWRTFNAGLSQADSDYVLLISADDLVAPGALGRAADLMEANPGVGLAYGHAQKFITEPKPKRPFPAVTWATWRGEDWLGMQLRRAWNNISSPEAVVRTRVQHEVGYYDPALKHTADVEMWLRIAAVTGVGHINGVDQAYYRRQATSHSARFSMYQDIEERWEAYDRFLTNWKNTTLAARYRPVVRRRLADEALFDLLGDLRNGDAAEELVTSVLTLAQAIDPEVSQRGSWADVQAQLNGRPAGAAGMARAAVREVAHRTRWHSWHRFRYFG